MIKFMRAILLIVAILFIVFTILPPILELKPATNLVALFALIVAIRAWLQSMRLSWWPGFWQAVAQIDNENPGKAKAGWAYLEQVIAEIPTMKFWENWLRPHGVTNVTSAINTAREVLVAREEGNHEGRDRCIKALRKVTDSAHFGYWWKIFNPGEKIIISERKEAIICTQITFPNLSDPQEKYEHNRRKLERSVAKIRETIKNLEEE